MSNKTNKTNKITSHLTDDCLVITYETKTGPKFLEVLKNGWCDLNDLDAFCAAHTPGHKLGHLDIDEMTALAKTIYRDYTKDNKASLHTALTNKVQEQFFASADTKKYPCIKLTLCDFALDVLSQEAKANNRSIQGEITNRLRATFYNDIEYRVRVAELQQSRIAFSNPKKYSLVVDRDLLYLLAASAIVDKRTLDEEVLLRIFISFVNPAEMELVNHCNALIRHNITNEEKDRQTIAVMAMSARIREATQNNGGGHAGGISQN